MLPLRLLLLSLCLLLTAPARAQPDNHALLAAGGAGGWLNTARPLAADDLKGRLVLLDFWTYGCINCMHIVPDLEYLEQAFGDRLLVIGVHSAKFRGEQGNDRILAAAKRFGLKHPVINDSDFAVWKSFGVNAWPTQVLLGPDGQEIERYTGEGHRDEIEKDIRTNLLTSSPAAPKPDWMAADEADGVLSFPARLAAVNIDGKGGPHTFYVADSGHNRILGFDETGRIHVVIGSGERGLKDGSFADARFNNPRGLAFFRGALYVADTENHALRLIDLQERTVSTVAGTGKQSYDRIARDRPAAKTALSSPWDVEPVDGQTLAIAMAGLHQLWSYDAEKKTVSVLAGNGIENIDDGEAWPYSTLAQPSGLSRSGLALFFADAESSALRVLENGRVETLIGTGLFDFGFEDGTYPLATLQHPQGLFAADDKIYVADTYNNALRVYDRKTRELSTIKLRGEPLNEPGDVLVSGATAWIADTNNHAIKKLNLETGELTPFPLVP